jgi:hypothetical protein
LFRTIAKNYFQNIEGFQDTILSYQNHEIGYWQKENKLNLLYFTYLQNLGSIKSNQLLNLISNEAIIWFNRLSYSELNFKFSKVQLGLNPVLID